MSQVLPLEILITEQSSLGHRTNLKSQMMKYRGHYLQTKVISYGFGPERRTLSPHGSMIHSFRSIITAPGPSCAANPGTYTSVVYASLKSNMSCQVSVFCTFRCIFSPCWSLRNFFSNVQSNAVECNVAICLS